MSESYSEFLASIKKLLFSAETDKALQALADYLQKLQSDLYYPVLELQLQDKLLRAEALKGTLSFQEISLESNRINSKVIQLIKQVEKMPPPPTSKPEALPPPLPTHTKDMVFVEGGAFLMGDKSTDYPSHLVELEGFFMDKHPVTNTKFAAFLNEYGTEKIKEGAFAGQAICFAHKWGIEKRHHSWQPVVGFEQHPMVWVTWYGAYEYARFHRLRLPTEAEWEYAAQAGNKRSDYLYPGTNKLEKVAWYIKNAGEKTHPVAQKKANELGLYDMSGNVAEWCADWHEEDYYQKSSKRNPTGPERGSFKVIRGGSWTSEKEECQIVARKCLPPGFRFNNVGFRCVR